MYKTDERLAVEDTIVKYITENGVKTYAADYAGIARDTLNKWENNSKRFSKRLAEAKAKWVAATTAQVKSKEWLLERLAPDSFSAPTQKVEIETTIRVALDTTAIDSLLPTEPLKQLKVKESKLLKQ